ncbi:MAG: Hsp20/alpha crystallin family protein, partial [Bryobacteraceae bacterium]
DRMWAQALAELERAERLNRRFFSPSELTARRAQWTPPVDIFEGPSEFVVQVALPDVDPARIECALNNHVLLVRGERRRRTVPPATEIRRVEIPQGRFERRLAIAAYRIESTSFVDGCLTLVLAK